MDGIIYLTLEQAEQIHRKTITYSGGGTYEPLDVGKLDSVLQHIQNDLYYPTFVDKLTHLFFVLVNFIALLMETKDLPSRYHYNFYYLTVIWESLKIL
ncbi:hypothetical protein M5E84_04680 [[Ruminococcus] torques]|nr:hypothetical protein M5E84_04680 [[Ruminococcus] torques]